MAEMTSLFKTTCASQLLSLNSRTIQVQEWEECSGGECGEMSWSASEGSKLGQ